MQKFIGFLRIIGFLFIIAPVVLTITFEGFVQNPNMEVKYVLIPDLQTLLVFNAVLGLSGGVLLDYRYTWASLAGGFMSAAGVTAVTMLYVSWRDSISNYEILIPLFIGLIPGFWAYRFVLEKVYHEKI